MRKGLHRGGAALFIYGLIQRGPGQGTSFAFASDMSHSDLLIRTRDFALRIIRLYASLPKTTEAQIMGKQLLRSGTSTGAHLREARFGRSDAEMLSKIEVGLQELEESRYWLELLVRAGILDSGNTLPLEKEIGELIAILVTSAKRLKGRRTATR